MLPKSLARFIVIVVVISIVAIVFISVIIIIVGPCTGVLLLTSTSTPVIGIIWPRDEVSFLRFPHSATFPGLFT